MTSADPVSSRRDQALDWLMRVQQAPHDTQLRAQLAHWCASDVANAEAYGKAERIWRLTGQLAPSTAAQWPPAPAAKVVPLPTRTAPRRRWWLGAAVAACLLVAIAPTLSVRLQADYRTAQGETRDITLADGSVVQMDSDTAIAVDYAGSHRDVRLLAGQAFFKVMPDKAKPFHVRADAVRVTVTGTAFNVELRPGGVGIDVEHGSVRVDDTQRAQALASALSAGQRLRYVDGLVQVRSFQPSQAAAWRQGQLIADEATVAELVAELERYLPGKVVLRDQSLGEQRVTGVYDLRKPEAALSAVVRPHGGKVTAYGPWLVILSRP
ncbi:FecR family protein [Pseudomonas urmiensis]|uniref:FecR domain-containing protein n=1 Tax=Pseudomonas urmiensis TaxID=2745493 RepID=A0A923FU02_9PSED|nr:FecR domain-containing protein [Pseudomonas urmiensis]MBV4538420.1 FecR domain-containing protein [Pseudomonas urmiensis]